MIDDSEVKEYIRLPVSIFGEMKDPVIRPLKGHRMHNAGLYDGDFLIFDSGIEPKDGDIVDAEFAGERRCCRFFREDGMAHFRAEDGVTEDVVTNDYTVHSVLVGVMRNCRAASEG